MVLPGGDRLFVFRDGRWPDRSRRRSDGNGRNRAAGATWVRGASSGGNTGSGGNPARGTRPEAWAAGATSRPAAPPGTPRAALAVPRQHRRDRRDGTGGSGASGGSAGTTGSAGAGDNPYPAPTATPADEDGSQLWLRYPKVNLAGSAGRVPGRDHPDREGGQLRHAAGGPGRAGERAQRPDGRRRSPSSTQPTAAGRRGDRNADLVDHHHGLALGSSLTAVGNEGYLVQATTVSGKAAIVVAGNTDIGVLHGTFALLRQLQCHHTLPGLALSESPKIQRRILDHWDNLDGSIERGYAGKSLWQWSALPGTLSQRYTDYARANASIGINGVVLNNVNADSQILTSSNLAKVAALATAFRPYGITVYLSAQFGAPQQIGGLSTADPTNSSVKTWWVNLAEHDLHDDPRLRRVPGQGQLRRSAGSGRLRTHARRRRQHAGGRAVTPRRHRDVARLRLQRQRHRSHRSVVQRVQTAGRQVQRRHDGPGEKRAARFPAARALPPAVRGDAQHAAGAGGADHQGVPRRGHPPRLSGTDVAGGPAVRHLRQGPGIAGGAGHRRHAARLQDHGDRRRGRHRERHQLDGVALQPGQLVRLRAPGVEPRHATRRTSPTSGFARRSPTTRSSSRR